MKTAVINKFPAALDPAEWSFTNFRKDQESEALCCLAYELERERAKRGNKSQCDSRTVERSSVTSFSSPAARAAREPNAQPWVKLEKSFAESLVQKQHEFSKKDENVILHLCAPEVEGPLERMTPEELRNLARRMERRASTSDITTKTRREMPHYDSIVPSMTFLFTVHWERHNFRSPTPKEIERAVIKAVRERIKLEILLRKEAKIASTARKLDAAERIKCDLIFQRPSLTTEDQEAVRDQTKHVRELSRQRKARLHSNAALSQLGCYRLYHHFLSSSDAQRGDKKRAMGKTQMALQAAGKPCPDWHKFHGVLKKVKSLLEGRKD